MSRQPILAVDIGTSATKAVVVGGDGRILALARKPYPVLTPRADWAEQDPSVVHAAVLAAMREAYAARPRDGIAGVSFSAQWYSIMPVRADGAPLGHYLTWSDRRAANIADRIRHSPEGPRISRTTGCPVDTIYPLAKIGWLQATEPGRAAWRFLSIKEYVFHRLFGEYVVDWCMASATGLFDIRARRWAPEALAAIDLPADALSQPVSPRTIFTRWRADALEAIGLPQGTPCVIGGGDGALASIGVGAAGEGVAAVNVGTSAAARCMIREPFVDDAGRLWTYLVDEGWWVIGGIVSSGGIVYDWFAREIGAGERGDVHLALDQLAASVPAGAEGLIFLPYLSGEQCPVWDPDTAGAFVGLTHAHGRGHLARAVLEGITGSLARVVNTIRQAVGEVREARVTGGLLNSAAWLQVAADMFETRIQVPASAEGSALGAAVIAWVALGAERDISSIAGLMPPARTVEPDASRRELYRGLLRRSDRMLAALKSARP